MEKKKLITGIVTGIVGLALVGTVAYLYVNLDNQKKENKAMQELAELDKKEMENEYQQFATQYSEMKTQISNDSIIAQLTAEQEKTERLLKELKDTKSNDAREIVLAPKTSSTILTRWGFSLRPCAFVTYAFLPMLLTAGFTIIVTRAA